MAKLVLFEGINGGGKSTTLKEMEKKLTEDGYKVYMLCDPGVHKDHPLYGTLRQITRNVKWSHPIGNLFSYSLARIELMAEIAKHDNEDKAVILLDRFIWSTMVYQHEEVNEYDPDCEILIPHNYRAPDLVLIFDIPAKEALLRARRANAAKGEECDQFEAQGVEAADKWRQLYLDFARHGMTDPSYRMFGRTIKVVDASKPIEEVHSTVYSILQSWLKETELLTRGKNEECHHRNCPSCANH